MHVHVRSLLATAGLALLGSALAQLGVASHPTLGPHLTTTDGYVLYAFVPDAQEDSTCVDGCADAWPPLIADGDVDVADDLDADAVGTIERADGSHHVTYFGWPLYTFAQDAEPGAANGQALDERWFVVAPDGTLVDGPEASASDDGATEMSQEAFDALYREGIRTYRTVCAACHGNGGDEVLSSHVVKIHDNDNLADASHVIRQVIHGNGYMPGFGGTLDDREVAAVVTYVRTSWNNEYGPVGEEEIAQYR